MSFLRSYSQMVYWYIVYCDHDLRNKIDILVKVLFLLSIIIFCMIRILAVLQIGTGKIVINPF